MPKPKIQFNLMLDPADASSLDRIARRMAMTRSLVLRRWIQQAATVIDTGMPRCWDGAPCPSPHLCPSPNLREPKA